VNIPLLSVGNPLGRADNLPGAYFVVWGRFMSMEWGQVACPQCSCDVPLDLPDSGREGHLVVLAGNLFSGEGLTFDRAITHALPHGCGATFRILDGSIVQ